jgi:CBS domain-containing protein
MNITHLMTTDVKACGQNDSLERAAQIMWETDCGIVPVVDDDNRVIAMITDRDICMAAYTQGRPLRQIAVSSAMSKQLHGVRENDALETVEGMMRRSRIRRVPVLDAGGHLKGILSINDLARHGHRTAGRNTNGLSGDSIMQTLVAICEPTATPVH